MWFYLSCPWKWAASFEKGSSPARPRGEPKAVQAVRQAAQDLQRNGAEAGWVIGLPWRLYGSDRGQQTAGPGRSAKDGGHLVQTAGAGAPPTSEDVSVRRRPSSVVAAVAKAAIPSCTPPSATCSARGLRLAGLAVRPGGFRIATWAARRGAD